MTTTAEKLSAVIAKLEQNSVFVLDPCAICTHQILGAARVKIDGFWCHKICVEKVGQTEH